MGRGGLYRKIASTFWRSPDIVILDKEQIYVLLYFNTCSHANMIGLYYLPLAYAATEAKLEETSIRHWINGVLAPHVSYDERTKEIFVHEMARHQIDQTLKGRDNRLQYVRNQLLEVQSSWLREAFLTRYYDWPLFPQEQAPWEGASQAPSKGLSKGETVWKNPLGSQKQEQNRTGAEKEELSTSEEERLLHDLQERFGKS